MNIIALIVREIRYRRLSFALGLVSVAVATGTAVGMLALLERHEARAEALAESARRSVEQMMRRLEDDFRKITLRMGFNMAILPAGQTLEGLLSGERYEYMPEEYARTLAQRKIATLNHLMPVLQQRIVWPEHNRPIFLIGASEEVYIQRADQKPLQEPIAPGTCAVGYVLWRDLKIRKGDVITFSGRKFTVAALRPGRGGTDDIALWIPLADAQAILNRPGQITAILGLECQCSGDRVAAVRREIASILGEGIQVLEFTTLAEARAESRRRAAQAAEEAVRHQREHQQRLGAQRRALAGTLVPVVFAACAVWIGFLAFANVRDRAGETGILRALGVTSAQILGLFLGRALVMGALGGLAGCALGWGAGCVWPDGATGAGEPAAAAVSFRPLWLVWSLLSAMVLTVLPSWPPAMLAAWRDPAGLLRED